MSRMNLKSDAQIVAEMMARGRARGRSGLGSGDPGPELVGRAYRAIRIAIRNADRVFKYQNPSYPFDRHEENRKYTDSFDVDVNPRGIQVANTAPSAEAVEYGRPAIEAKSGKYLSLPLKDSAYGQMRARQKAKKRLGRQAGVRGVGRPRAMLTMYQGKPYLLVKRVRASDGYAILTRALFSSYSR